MRASIPPCKLLCLLVIWILILPAPYSNANWIKTQSHIAGTNLSYAPYATSASSEPTAPFIPNSSYNQNYNSNSDSLPTGVTKDWLNRLRDENGNKIMPGEFETDFIQRNTFNPLGPSEGFGGNVRSAGDVNNDGFDDIIIGALHYKSDTGRAYIYYGGTNWDTEPDVIMKGEAYSEFGGWVSSAGDVNGDGYDDVIIGASRYNSNTGRAYIFFGGASMNNIADLIMTGEAPNSYLGNSVSSAGDVNNDGFSDVIIGACGNNSIMGKTYIYYGGTTMNAVEDVMMNGEITNSYFGNSVSTAGDVNNDGYSDVIVGAFWYNGGTGRSYIFYGGAAMDPSADVTMNGEGGYFGVNVSNAGDVNGDGFGDVIVGAYRYGSSNGKVYLYFGGSTMNKVADITMTGEEPNALFGMATSSAGDLNRDGYSDIIIGAAHDFSPADTGKAYVFFGGASMNNIADVTLSGESLADNFGVSVASAGDFNGDGYTELLVGASEYNSQRGRVYFYEYNVTGNITSDTLRKLIGAGPGEFLGGSVSSAGDVNRDGFIDIIVGSANNNSDGKAYIYFGGLVFDTIPDVIMYGEAGQGSEFGNGVSSAGDVNGDGYSDVIVAGKHYNSNTGRAYIFLGGAVMDNVPDIIMTGQATDRYLGSSVSSDDFNKDGFSDVLVGEPGYSSNTGRAYIFFGAAAMDNIPDVTMTGESNGSYFGMVSSPAGDVNGDSYPDVIVSAMNYLGETGRAYIFYGGTMMDATADLTLNGENGHFGSWTAAGDLNGDGFSDVIVGAYRYGSNDAGKVYIFFGGSSMNNSADITFNGTGSNALLGNTIACVGDLNNDGYSDIILPENLNGKAYIYFGGALMDIVPDIIKYADTPGENYAFVSAGGDINGDGHLEYLVGAPWFNSSTGKVYIYDYKTEAQIIPDMVMNGETTNNYFGYAVSSAGDVNNDGYDDVIVGAPEYNSRRGRAYIFFGGAQLNNAPDIILNGQGGLNYFGISVSSAGDVNNDNYSDVIVGAHGAGKAYIYFGGSTMDASADVVLDAGEGGYFGMAVSTAGDVNSDSYSDVIVGAYRYGADVGRVYIYFGGAAMNPFADLRMTGEETDDIFGMTVSSAGDVNRDGYSDVIVGAPHELPPNGSDTGKAYIYYGGANMDTIADVKMYGEQVADDFGVVSSAGDVNGDGFSDVIVTSLTYNNIYGSQDGRAYIYFGDSSMNNVADVVLYGEIGSQFGRTPSASDINGDGYSDVIVGSEQYDSKRGKVYIYYGGSQMNNMADLTMTGETKGDCFGVAVSSGGDVNNDMFPDIIAGAPEHNSLTGKAYIYLASAIGSPSNKSFRSKVSGNWNSPLTWEMSTDEGGSWVQATSYPNELSDDITIQSPHVVTLTSNVSASLIVINTGAALNISSMTLKLSHPGIPLFNNGTLITANGTIEYNSISPQTLVTANVNYINLTINNPAGVTLSDSLYIPGLLSILNGSLDLNGKKITLLDTARLFETPGNTVRGNSGFIITTRNINQPDSLDIAGLGAVVTSSENFGLTTITREHNVQNVNPGKPSIKRNFTISPQYNTALNAHLVFKYDISELDTLNEYSLGLYQSTNSGVSYKYEGGTIDTANDQIALNHVQYFSKYTAARDSGMSQYISDLTANLYAKGKVCLRWGTVDTINIRIKNLQAPQSDSIKINYLVKQRNNFSIILDTVITVLNFDGEDTLVYLHMPDIVNPGPYTIIVQAIPDELEPINGFDIQTYCIDVTCDAFSYAEPCNSFDGGAGFNGSFGRMSVAFTNLNPLDSFPIYAIDHSFLDSVNGLVPYKLAIYDNNDSGKPGDPLYISQELHSPERSNYVQTVTHIVDPPVFIPPHKKFYVGYIQTSFININAAFQNEIPVRSNAFYFSNSTISNEWFDFADSSKNLRLDISPRTSTSLTLNAFLGGLYNLSGNTMTPDTVNLEIRSFNYPYTKIDEDKSLIGSDGKGIFDFLNVVRGAEYYFVIQHRNHIETWSHAIPENFNLCDKVYDFTDNITKAFGQNQIKINNSPEVFAFYSGDVDQDGVIDLTDVLQTYNNANSFVSGYVVTDINGDDVVDLNDVLIAYNNSVGFVSAVKP